ncbi:MAG: pyridoxamine kinase [Bacillota bacterium]|nr:pyridoxamine kinase [Bacillota bacterium]
MSKKVLSVQDISCFGQCSTTVALPIISACGVECAILPTAILSTHTAGKFRDVGFTCLDLADEVPAIIEKWEKLNLKFDCVYTGYLGSVKHIDYVKKLMKEDCYKVVDPAMADNGELYPAFDMNYVEAMKSLCAMADVVLPNISEACLLTGSEYKEVYTEGYVRELCYKLEALGCKNIVLTGVSFKAETTGVAVYEAGSFKYYEHKKISTSFHGTGDIYSSVFVGAKMRGLDTYVSAGLAAAFTCGCIEKTIDDKEEHWYGVKFEPALKDLPLAIDTILSKEK